MSLWSLLINWMHPHQYKKKYFLLTPKFFIKKKESLKKQSYNKHLPLEEYEECLSFEVCSESENF